MRTQSVEESPRRNIGRRIAAAGMAVAAGLTLAACDGRGGGYIGGPIPQTTNPVFNGDANFGFTFQCGEGVKGQITYHDTSTKASPGGLVFPGLRLHGTVTNVLVDSDLDPKTPAKPAVTCDDVEENRYAQFQGTYRSQETTLLSKAPGTFTVVVFDQGEPGRTKEASITGDFFSINLVGGPYPLYDRSGYIEGGNIQVNK
jgi:hypothetical protein